jgi:hypothetical protein
MQYYGCRLCNIDRWTLNDLLCTLDVMQVCTMEPVCMYLLKIYSIW